MRASASKRPVTRAQVYKRDSSGVAPASPQVAYRALLERCIGRPPKKVGRIFGPRRGLRLPAWPRLGHNFANDLAVSIDERHSPLRFIAAERLRGRVKRRARGGPRRNGQGYRSVGEPFQARTYGHGLALAQLSAISGSGAGGAALGRPPKGWNARVVKHRA